jgi:hypothetical protein
MVVGKFKPALPRFEAGFSFVDLVSQSFSWGK